MASDSRTLKLAILGEVKDLSASLNKGATEVSTFGDKITKFGKVAGLAFAAAGAAAVAYAGKLAIDGVKAAIEDEAAQLRLATSLKNVTGATDAQIASTEAYILKTELAYGITDNELRPSLDRLVRSTKNVEEAQKLQTLALDIAAGTGKSLEVVTNALAKAHDGSTTALGKLGTGIDKATLKTMTFDEVTQSLSNTFANQATKQADTFQGKMDRLSVAFQEGKETIGGFILDAITPMINTIVKDVVPAVQSFIEGIGGKEGISAAIKNFIDIVKSIAIPIFEGLRYAFDKIKGAVSDNKDSFEALFKFMKEYVAPFFGGAMKLAIEALGTALGIILGIVGKVISAFQTLISLGSKVASFVGGAFGGGRAGGGSVSAGTTYLVGEKGPELFTAGSNGAIIPNNAISSGGGNTVNITVNGAVDPISTARQIANLLNKEATLSGSFNRIGSSLLVGA
jgi:hypothetical protein